MEDEVSSQEFIHDQGTYQDTYEAYSAGRREQQEYFIVNQLFPNIISRAKDNVKTFKVLTVGAGEGCFDLNLLDEFINSNCDAKISFKPSRIEWTVVEPNMLAIELFKEKVRQLNESVLKVEFHWINKTFKDFLAGLELPVEDGKFHLVLFISCLYYMDENFAVNETIAKLVVPSGQIVIAVGTESDIWSLMMKEFKAKVKSLTTGLHYLTAKDISKLADQHGYSYEVMCCRMDVHITDMWIEDSPSGTALLKFFLHTTEDPRKTLGPEIITEFLRFLKRHSYTKVEEGKEKILVRDDIGFVLL